MSETPGGAKLLVVTGEQSFGRTVADRVEATETTVSAEQVAPGEAREGAIGADVAGAVVDGRLPEAVSVVEQFTPELPVVVLSPPADETVGALLEAGATDVFPRTATPAQCELLVDRLDSSGTERTPYRELFETVTDGLVVHDPDTGEMLDVNDRFCEMAGYDRGELVGEPVGQVITDGPDADGQAEKQLRSEEPLLFEGQLEHRDGETFPVEGYLRLVSLHGGDCVLASVRDITERKRREREYEQIFNGVPSPLTVNDPETGELLEVNDALCETLGYDKGTILEKGNDGLALNEEGYTGERATEIVNRVMESGEPETFEWKLEAADGSRRVLEVTGKPAEINGEPRYVSLTRDITERRQREHEYEQIFNKVRDAIAVFEPERGEIVDVNDRYRELLGYDDLETIRELGIEGLSVTAEGYTGERGKALIREVSETGEPTTVEWQAATSDGEQLWLEATLAPAEIGGERRVLSIQRDITEQRELERTYQGIFENVSDGLVIHDPETGEVLEVNEQYCELTGYDREELLDGTIQLIMPDDPAYTYEDALERIRDARRDGPQLFEFRGQRKDGEPFVGEIHLKTIDIRGEERVLASVRDVTERTRRERAIQALQDATERLQTAQTPGEVAQIAVDAASDALDLPLVLCWLENGERLAPAAATDPVYEAGLEWTVTPGEYEYDVFRDGEVSQYTPSDQSKKSPLETGILLPLSTHGLVLAGTVEETEADSAVLSVAKALADHVTTALDRVEREQAVRESERRFRLIAERIEEVIYLAKPDFSEVLYVNPAYEEIWGQPTDALYDDARAFLDSVDKRDRAEFAADLDAMIEEMQAGDPADSYEFEFRLRRPNAGVRWVTASGYAVELPGEKRRFVGIAEDITDRKRREQRLEVFNRILRHNLRNKLDVIRSNAEVLAAQTDGEYAECIIAAVDELASIGAEARKTDQIMSMEDNASEIHLGEAVREVLAGFDPDQHEIELSVDMAAAGPVQTNESAVQIAIESAVENAIEYAESSVAVSVTAGEQKQVVTIEDDGPGIPDEELIPIEAGTETSLSHGKGLGLWQLRWSVNKCNGELSFETGPGTTVRIAIPRKP